MKVCIASCSYLGLIACCLNCGHGDGKRNDSHEVRFNPEKLTNPIVLALEPFPFPDKFSAVTSSGDFIEIKRFVKLEAREESVIARIDDIEFLEGQWFILDEKQRQVLRFTADGGFSGSIGRRGQGPGEYETPTGLTRWGEYLAVTDGGRGRVLLYRADGRFERGIATWEHGISVNNLVAFIGDRIYIPDFAARSEHVPNHVILDVSQAEWRVVWGFGRRFPPPYRDKKIRGFHFSAFARVGDYIWSCSPFTCFPEIYDADGRLVKVAVPGMDGLRFEDYEGLRTNDEIKRLKESKPWGYKIIDLHNMVLVYFLDRTGLRMNVYEMDGDLVKANLEVYNFHIMTPTAIEGQLVTEVCLGYLNLDFIKKTIDDREYGLLVDAGFDPQNRDEDNPYLVVSGLKETL